MASCAAFWTGFTKITQLFSAQAWRTCDSIFNWPLNGVVIDLNYEIFGYRIKTLFKNVLKLCSRLNLTHKRRSFLDPQAPSGTNHHH